MTLGGGNPHPSMLRLIINTKMSLTQELEFLGILVNTTTLLVSLPADKVKDTNRSYQNLQHGLPLSSLALPLPREGQHSNPGYSSSPTILPLPAERLCNQDYEAPLSVSQSTQKNSPGGENTFSNGMERQVRSSYHQLRCLPTRPQQPV